MKTQGQREAETVFSVEQMEKMRQRYDLLQQDLIGLPWVLQGTVVETPPKTTTARATCKWTRKVKAKTVTVSLSPEQATAFRTAIAANRRVEKALKEMRELSQNVLLNSLPRSRTRAPSRVGKQGETSSQTGLI